LLTHIPGHDPEGGIANSCMTIERTIEAVAALRRMSILERGDVPAVVALWQQLPCVDDYYGSAELSTMSGE